MPKYNIFLLDATNRPISGARSDNYFYSMYMMPISLDIREFKQAKNPEDGKMYWWEKGSGQNPYWAKDYNTNQDKRNRFLLNGSLKYQITDWLNAEIKAGSDMYFTETEPNCMLAVLHQKTVVILLVNKNSMKIISVFWLPHKKTVY